MRSGRKERNFWRSLRKLFPRPGSWKRKIRRGRRTLSVWKRHPENCVL